MRISDWSSDVCSSDLAALARDQQDAAVGGRLDRALGANVGEVGHREDVHDAPRVLRVRADVLAADGLAHAAARAVASHDVLGKNGRASWRERVCQYV